jgi:hypothetical protein
MPTAKKTTKKTAPKKAPVKATAAKRTGRSTKAHKAPKSHPTRMRSFRVYRSQEPFFTFRVSHQTVYWLVLCGSVLLLGLWVLDINQKVQHIYDQIDETNVIINSMPDPIAKQSR